MFIGGSDGELDISEYQEFSFVESTILAVVCLMIASKLQIKESPLIDTEARKLLIKLSKTQSSHTDPKFSLELRDMR